MTQAELRRQQAEEKRTPAGCIEHVNSCQGAFNEVKRQAAEWYGISYFAVVYFNALNEKIADGDATLVDEKKTVNGRRQRFRIWMSPYTLLDVCFSPRHGCVIGLYPPPLNS